MAFHFNRNLKNRNLYWVINLNVLSKDEIKYLLGSAVIYLDSVVNAGADYAVRRVVESDSSHLIFAFQVIDWAPFFKSDKFNFFWNSLIFDTLLYRTNTYFITCITFDNKPRIELNFWSVYLNIYHGIWVVQGHFMIYSDYVPSSTIPYLDSCIIWCRTNKWIASSCSVNSINNTVMAFHSLQSCSCSIVEHSDSVIRWGCEYMFAFLTKLEIQNGTLKIEFKYFEGYRNQYLVCMWYLVIIETFTKNFPIIYMTIKTRWYKTFSIIGKLFLRWFIFFLQNPEWNFLRRSKNYKRFLSAINFSIMAF